MMELKGNDWCDWVTGTGESRWCSYGVTRGEESS